MAAALGAGLLLLLCAGLWLLDRSRYVYTEDARAAADMVTVSAEVAGRIVDTPAAPGEAVAVGQPLARLDTAEVSLAISAIAQDIRAMEAEVAREAARSRMTRHASAARTAGYEASVGASDADLSVAQALLATAEAEAVRVGTLHAAGLVTRPALERSADNLERARQGVARAEAARRQTRAGLSEARAEAGEADIIERSIDVLHARAEGLRKQLGLRKLALDRHVIKSPVAGVVDELFVDAGEQVEQGQRIALLHDPSRIWIDANVPEPDIARIRTGAPVEIRFDAMPGRVFNGRVVQVRAIAANQLALIPSSNPAGVFTKITQRVPVRVQVMDEHAGARPGALRPGAMARLRIQAMHED